MPELPEVETVRRGLEPVMTGHKIVRADIRRPDLRWPFPVDMAARLTDKTVTQLRRRSKYILVDLDSAETLIIHLGMSGRMLIDHSGTVAPEKHDHVIFDMSGGARVTFNDARRFGMMDMCATNKVEAHKLIAGLGPEPLGNQFDAHYLADRFKGRKMPVKSALLDQRIIAGLGNIYVCEALWRAQLSPDLAAGKLSSDNISALVPIIRTVLEDAIKAGGSSLKDFRQTDGELGYFQHSFAVYGREGQPCQRAECAGTIARFAQAGRSTFHCPRCQQQG
ncbi:MAG: bifunctional DNA-formamidopyrimidine glycosylase/DNA-(apurinic or apyrimidinic site) lyase [Rhodobacteraceae bacterium]|nr:bifunctional DNA-formamidopyrimidine glycosylase/DNA-(apurinic or apyrimidinic site) lyase [Paracoccaceae bacterium]